MPYDNSYNNRPGEEPWGNKNPAAGCCVVLAAFLVVSAIVTWGLSHVLAG